ncbi:MAG: M24 family metallopeptidase [Cytophagales bacterium]|nr:MAG: M24 family metallopeptidase [Cytophagales bacterium]
MARYTNIDSAFYINNRIKLQKELKENSIVILLSNDIMPTNADGVMGFKQQSDLFYLTGIDQEDTFLLLSSSKDNEVKEILFIKETNEHIATWEGNKLNKKEAFELSGIKEIYWSHQFENVLKNMLSEVENIYLYTNEHNRYENDIATRNDRFLVWCKEKYPLHHYYRLYPITSKFRTIKSLEEIAQIQNACNITEKAFRRILPFIQPGKWEFEIEAEIIHEFIINRSRTVAYPSIIASGGNACVLHYTENNNQCRKGDLLLMDFGAEFGNYAADLTRCVPVSGKFSKRQKQIYQSVQNILFEAQQLLTVGNNFKDYIKEVASIVEKELVKLKLISLYDIKKQDPKQPEYKKYFMHGISHYLGLDVHDVGSRDTKFKTGMVLTCEPGIYVKSEKIGVRLENNILIQKKGNLNLMKNIPIEVEEIEALMN